jgi:hypothetical protein
MSTTGTTSGQLDVEALRRAIEARDAAAQVALFAPDAELIMIDKAHPPSMPEEIKGTAAIRASIEDVCARDMTHRVTHMVSGPGSAAYTVACRYADGTQVRSAMMLDVGDDGLIVRQEGVQAWDEG